jgi:hypothetical protein
MKFRNSFWDAPTTHQVIMSLMLISLGMICLTGNDIQLHGIALGWLFSPFMCVLTIVFGCIGIFTALFNTYSIIYYLRLAFCVFNFLFFFALAFCFARELRVGTVVYPGVMIWANWLLFRVAYDKKVKVFLAAKKVVLKIQE